MENLCSLAVQCNIEPEQVEKDCRMIAEHFEKLTIDDNNHFTEYDILCALKTYHDGSEQAYRRRIEFISKKTGIELVPSKRNGRKQVIHLERARAVQIVRGWQALHPDGRKADCIRETGLSKPTVYKWWQTVKYEK